MKKDVLIVLGSPNTPTGELSDISKSRLNYCKNYFSEKQLVICSGGWGEHFNTSQHAHATYAKAYLIENGLPEACFLKLALSSNTVDDAVKIKPILETLGDAKLLIITSDYHLERVSLIFKTILKTYDMSFIGVDSSFLDEDHLNNLIAHEKKAIQSILKNGLDY